MIKRLYKPLLYTALVFCLFFADVREVYAETPARQTRDTASVSAAGESGGEKVLIDEVYLIGEPAGVRLLSDGVIIAGMADVITDPGAVCPAKDAGLRDGDVILSVDGDDIGSADELINAVERSQGKALLFTVRRTDGSVERISITPVYSSVDNCFRAGLWIKDGTSGIGVISFVEPKSLVFGAVGHPLGSGGADNETLGKGILESVRITGVRKGTRGLPGELIGYLGEKRLGTVSANCELGVFGHLQSRESLSGSSQKLFRIASESEVTEGPAQLLIKLPGSEKPELYNIVIEKIDRMHTSLERNITIRVTDKRLLNETGGIVQGMSGAPIIQKGKYAASVTHVFVSDPTRGYAVFAEKMIEFSKTIYIST